MGKVGVLKAKDVEVIDKKTGEVISGTWFILAPKDVDIGFCKFFIPLIEELYKDETITKNAIRLFFWIVSHLDYNSLEFVLIPDIVCKDLGISRATYFRWKEILLKKGLIARKVANIYMVKPYGVIKGHMSKVGSQQIKEFYGNQEDKKEQA